MSRIQIPWERYEQSGPVGARAELDAIRLLSLNTALKDFAAKPPYVAQLEVRSSFQRDDGANHVVVSAEYSLTALAFGPDQDTTDEATQPELVAAEVNCTLLALFSLREVNEGAEEARSDELEAFAETVGLMALHPYARELIQDQTGRLGLPALTIGVAQIAKLAD